MFSVQDEEMVLPLAVITMRATEGADTQIMCRADGWFQAGPSENVQVDAELSLMITQGLCTACSSAAGDFVQGINPLDIIKIETSVLDTAAQHSLPLSRPQIIESRHNCARCAMDNGLKAKPHHNL